MTTNNFCILHLPGSRVEADLFVQLSIMFETLLTENSMEKVKPVVPVQHVFDSMKSSIGFFVPLEAQ